MKINFLPLLAAILFSSVLSAAEYVLTIDSGEADLQNAMKSAYPDAVLEAGDKIVKKGAGCLLDSADALDLSSKLVFVVEEGVFIENVARKSSTYSVSNGAAVVVKVDLTDLSRDIENLAVFELAGSGTSEYPGALCIDKASASAQYIYYRLLDDATIFTSQAGATQLSSTNDDSRENNIFEMNGHTLRLAGDKSGAYFRFRFVVTFKNAGEILLDGVGLTSYTGGRFFFQNNPKKIPRIKLINGARLNCVNQTFANIFDMVECDYGTKICTVKDTPGAYALRCLVGCPEITSDQSVTVSNYIARAEDLLSGKKMSVDGTLAFAEGGSVCVDRFWNLAKGVSYDVLSGFGISGGPRLSNDATDMEMESSPSSVSVRFNGDYSGNFLAFVPQGKVYGFNDVTCGVDMAQYAGYPLMKLGGGVLAPNNDEDVAGSVLSELIVANGVFALTEYNHTPTNDKGKVVSVYSGATFRFEAPSYTKWASSDSKVVFKVSGKGFEGESGAVVFTEEMKDKNRQYAEYNLMGDTVFSFPCGGQFNFSSGFADDQNDNIFNMNGHSLTLKRPGEHNPNDTHGIRFRYAVSFNNPGTLIMDNLLLTHLAGSAVYVNGRSKSHSLPVKLLNGAKLHCIDAYLTDAISELDCANGTSLYIDNNASYNACSFPVLIGAPSIIGGLSLTVREGFHIRAEDVNARQFLDSDGDLSFAEGCKLTIDRKPSMEIPEEGVVIAKALGSISGRLDGSELQEYGLKSYNLSSADCSCVYLCKRKALTISIR